MNTILEIKSKHDQTYYCESAQKRLTVVTAKTLHFGKVSNVGRYLTS
jgi:hypothetical protein